MFCYFCFFGYNMFCYFVHNMFCYFCFFFWFTSELVLLFVYFMFCLFWFLYGAKSHELRCGVCPRTEGAGCKSTSGIQNTNVTPCYLWLTATQDYDDAAGEDSVYNAMLSDVVKHLTSEQINIPSAGRHSAPLALLQCRVGFATVHHWLCYSAVLGLLQCRIGFATGLALPCLLYFPCPTCSTCLGTCPIYVFYKGSYYTKQKNNIRNQCERNYNNTTLYARETTTHRTCYPY